MREPTAQEKIQIAAKAAVSLRTVDKFFAGFAVRDNTATHIHTALEALGLEHVVAPRRSTAA